jgi:hypothetical protein
MPAFSGEWHTAPRTIPGRVRRYGICATIILACPDTVPMKCTTAIQAIEITLPRQGEAPGHSRCHFNEGSSLCANGIFELLVLSRDAREMAARRQNYSKADESLSAAHGFRKNA